jgi:hypothetical protein
MSQLHEELRKKFIDIEKELNLVMEKSSDIKDDIIDYLENEPDIDKRKELIENVFNGLDTLFQGYLKNVYLR